MRFLVESWQSLLQYSLFSQVGRQGLGQRVRRRQSRAYGPSRRERARVSFDSAILDSSKGDKSTGVVGLVCLDMVKRGKIGRLGMCGTNGTKLPDIRVSPPPRAKTRERHARASRRRRRSLARSATKAFSLAVALAPFLGGPKNARVVAFLSEERTHCLGPEFLLLFVVRIQAHMQRVLGDVYAGIDPSVIETFPADDVVDRSAYTTALDAFKPGDCDAQRLGVFEFRLGFGKKWIPQRVCARPT